MTVVLSDCYKLMEICDYLGCISLISKPIEVALLQHGLRLLSRDPERTLSVDRIGLPDSQ